MKYSGVNNKYKSKEKSKILILIKKILTGLEEACRNDDQCYSNYDFESTSCIEGRCQCSDGYYQREYSACHRASYGIVIKLIKVHIEYKNLH